MEKIHVCVLMPSHWSGSKGGAELQARYIMNYLEGKANIRVSYICRNVASDNKQVNIHQIPKKVLSKYFYFTDKNNILNLLNQIKPDYIYQRVLCSYTGIAAKYCKKNNAKMVFHIANSPDVEPQKIKLNKFFLGNVIEKYYRKFGLNNSDFIVAQAEYQDKLLLENYKKKCDLIMPNISPDVFLPTGNSNLTRKKIILWVANIKEQKGPDVFIKLAKDFLDNKELEFHMAGKVQSRYGVVIKQEARATDNIVFHGELPIEEINRLMSEAIVFVNTSKFEGFPNTFIQAWLNKTPVLSLNVDPDGIVEKNDLGRLSGDYLTLKANLNKMINNEIDIKKIGEKSRLFSLDYFSVNNVEKLYNLICNDYDGR